MFTGTERDVTRQIIARQEGTGPTANGRLYPYLDCCGKRWRQCCCETKGALTIGHGRNLDANGITPWEALQLLDTDLDETERDLDTFPWFAALNVPRRVAVRSWRFNLGPTRWRRWAATISYLASGDPVGAARQFLTNRLYRAQVKSRATWIADTLESGEMR